MSPLPDRPRERCAQPRARVRRRWRGVSVGLAGLVGALACSAAVAATALKLSDFEAALPLAVPTPGGLQQVPLEAAVWRAARHADLRDLRVFNGRGESLPWSLASPGGDVPLHGAIAPAAEVPMVVLPALPDARERLIADAAVQVRRSADGSVTVTMPAGPAPGARVPPGPADAGGYLFDLRGLATRSGTLVLRFAPEAGNVADAVRIVGSDDLVAWRPVAHGPLVRDVRVSPPVEHARFALRDAPRFLRLDGPAAAAGPAADRAVVRLAGARFEPATPPAPAWVEMALAPTPVADEPDAVQVEIPPALPMRGLVIRPTALDTVVRIRVQAWQPRMARHRHRIGPLPLPRRHAPGWELLAERDVFRVQRDGVTIESPPLTVVPTGTVLRVSTEPGAGGAAGKVADLTFAALWAPARLVFVARGEPPFTVAVGRDDADLPAPTPLDLPSLLAADDPAGLRLPVARIATTAAAAGTAAAEAAPGAPPARAEARAPGGASRAVLWAVLAGAVLLVTVMAVAVWRQMKAGPAAPAVDR